MLCSQTEAHAYIQLSLFKLLWLHPVVHASILGPYPESEPTQPRPLHRICAQDTGLTQWANRGSIILTTWLKMWKMTAFTDMQPSMVLCICHLWRDFRSWFMTVFSSRCLTLLWEHAHICATVTIFPHTQCVVEYQCLVKERFLTVGSGPEVAAAAMRAGQVL